MATPLEDRPFENYRAAISSPDYFFGRQSLLESIKRSPFRVRILLGGRRCGKTSALNAICWSLLNRTQANAQAHALPVLINLQQEQPNSLDNLRYLLIARLRETLEIYRQDNLSSFRRNYKRFLRQIPGGSISIPMFSLDVTNPDVDRALIHEDFRQDLLKLLKKLQKFEFDGVCFLFDGAEFIVQQDWANDAWSYFRALKDTDTAIKPFLGLIFSGYRNLRDYQQRVGSPLLNIAELDWLSPLEDTDATMLIAKRCQDENILLPEVEVNLVSEWSGRHPYLIQQVLNNFLNSYRKGQSCPPETLLFQQIRQHDRDFSSWWDASRSAYGFSEIEQSIYLALSQCKESSIKSLAQQTRLSLGNVADTLEVLVGTGVVLPMGNDKYKVGAKLFEEWVLQEKTPTQKLLEE